MLLHQIIYIYSGAALNFHQYFNKLSHFLCKIKLISILRHIQYQNICYLFQKNISFLVLKLINFLSRRNEAFIFKDRIIFFLLFIKLKYYINYIFPQTFFYYYKYFCLKLNDLHLAPLYIYVCASIY